jgi:hypothetical protein
MGKRFFAINAKKPGLRVDLIITGCPGRQVIYQVFAFSASAGNLVAKFS